MINKSDFPIFKDNYLNQSLTYLDNAATTQKPQVMIDTLNHYYTHMNSNIGRGVYHLAEVSTQSFENTRKNIAQFIHAKKRNIIFTSGATASLNLAAHLVSQKIKPGDKIVLSIVEHHANILPWQRIARDHNCELVFIDNAHDLEHPENLPNAFWDNVAVVALTHVSNVTGQINPVKTWCQIAREHKAFTVIDGAQGVTTTLVNVTDIECDFYAFSAHKLYGPMGVGVLYIKDELINIYEPLILGGGTIEDVNQEQFFLLQDYARYEAGTPSVADIVAFNASLNYLIEHNWPETLETTHRVGEYLYNAIKKHPDLIILDMPDSALPHSHIISFFIENIHAHDVGTFLANKNIAVRVGKHCTHPLHTFLNNNSSIRASVGIYNTQDDVDTLIKALDECILFFRSH